MMEESELWSAYRNTPTQKGQLRDPAQAGAIAKCLISRLVGERKGDNRLITWDTHPRRCAYCSYVSERLWTVYEDWMQWSGLEKEGSLHPSVEAFYSLPREIQQAEVKKAQGYAVRMTGRTENGTRKEIGDGKTEGVPTITFDPGGDPPPRVAEDDRDTVGEER